MNPIGKQDQYVAAHGGICAYTFHPSGDVEVEPLELDTDTLDHLRERLLLFYTGDARSASAVLSDQNERSKAGDPAMIENLHRTKEIGFESRKLLEKGDLRVVRGTHARTLGEQTPSIAWNGERTD